MNGLNREPRSVVVIGAGPVGLAAAAHLLERGLDAVVLEAGGSVGASVLEWGHVRVFSPWRYNLDAAAIRLLGPTGWERPPDDDLPTGQDLVERYLRPLAETPSLAGRIHLGTRVLAVTRLGLDKTPSMARESLPFLVRTIESNGDEIDFTAAAVIDASGTFEQPNPLGASGVPARGEAACRAYLAGPLPDVLDRDRARFAGRRVLVVGSGHSAAGSLLDLVELRRQVPTTAISWAIRSVPAATSFGGGDTDALPARGRLVSQLRSLVESGSLELVSQFAISELRPHPGGPLTGPAEIVGCTPDGKRVLVADVVVAATGFRPDLLLAREIRLSLDPTLECPEALVPLIDPNGHSWGTAPMHGEAFLTHPDPGFYVVGMKSYGRVPTFLMATGYEQVRSIAAALAGDRAAADTDELVLPEIGACSGGLGSAAGGAECRDWPAPYTLAAPADLVEVGWGGPPRSSERAGRNRVVAGL